jgi:hypothetical protein
MDKFTGSTIIDTDGAVNTPHNYTIEVLSCKSDLKRYIYSHRGLIMSKSLHSTEEYRSTPFDKLEIKRLSPSTKEKPLS